MKLISAGQGEAIPAACDESELSLETVNLTGCSRADSSVSGRPRYGTDCQAPLNADSLDEMALVSPAGKC